MNPNLSDIYYFKEVAESGNLSRAAERLGVTQPSLSVAMKRLEAAVDCELLIRSKTGVTLTRVGKEFLKKSRHLVNQWESLKDELKTSEVDPVGEYSFGCHPSVGMYTLPKFLPSLMQAFPKLTFKFEHDHSRKISERIIRFDIDLGIVVNPTKHPDLIIKELCIDHVRFWVNGEKKKKVLAKKVLICDPDLLQSQKMLSTLKRDQIDFEAELFTVSLELVSKLTLAGAGIGVIPTRVAKLQGGVDLVPLKQWPEFKDRICLVYRHEMRQNRAFVKIVDAITSASY